jgi:hypothetical protein
MHKNLDLKSKRSLLANTISKTAWLQLRWEVTSGYQIKRSKKPSGLMALLTIVHKVMTIGTKHFLSCAYNANPSSMHAALESFAEMPVEKKIVILGDMLELGEVSLQEHKIFSVSEGSGL